VTYFLNPTAERFLAAVGPEVIDPASIAFYLGTLEGLAPATRAHHISAIKTFCKFGQRQAVLPPGPLDLLVRPHVAITSANRVLNHPELLRLVEAACRIGPRAHAAVLTLAETGLRVSELAEARWQDLYRDSQGRLGLWITYGKGGKARPVAIKPPVFAALAKAHGSDQLAARDPRPLLANQRGKHFTQRGLGKIVRQAARRAGIDKPVSPHWLRHSHFTLAALNGAPVYTIQSSAGHAHIESNERYLHLAIGLQEQTPNYTPDLTKRGRGRPRKSG
jgi:integrase/recombinase XerD